jgi:hypothetical protein
VVLDLKRNYFFFISFYIHGSNLGLPDLLAFSKNVFLKSLLLFLVMSRTFLPTYTNEFKRIVAGNSETYALCTICDQQIDFEL